MSNVRGTKPNYALRRAVVSGGALTLVAVLVLAISAMRDGTDSTGSVSPATVSPVSTEPDRPPLTEPAHVGLSAEELATIRPNEAGVIPVFEYHLIEPGENGDYTRTPESFRADLEWLVAHHYVPIRFRDLTSGSFDVPAGSSPVVLTFDDSSIGQFRILDDGTVDPTTAMGIMLDVAAQHPDFRAAGTFFPLLDVDVDSRILWGQPDLVDEKLKIILDAGGEIGCHTVSHERLDRTDADRVRWQLAVSSSTLQDRVAAVTGAPYDVVSLALPLGMYPSDESLIHSGEAEGHHYAFTAAAEVGGGPTASPFSNAYDAYHVDRVQAIDGYLDGVLEQLTTHPELVFVSDGNPEVITVPTDTTLGDEQRATFVAPAGWPASNIIRYDRP